MIPWCKNLYLLLCIGVHYEAVFGGFSFSSCTFTKKIPDWPYEETRTQTCVTSCCEKDCCPTTDIEVWTWVAVGASPVVVISVIVLIVICCKRDKKTTHSTALPRAYVPPPRHFTDTYNEDFTALPSASAASNIVAHTSRNGISENVYSYEQDGDHVILPLGRVSEIRLKNDDYAAHSSVQAALNSISQTSISDSGRNSDHVVPQLPTLK